ALDPGDVLFIELGAPVYESSNLLLPPEAERVTFEAIKLATAGGVVVLEGAGNGNLDLDEYERPTDRPNFILTFNRAIPDFEDSGAIIVGAAYSGTGDARIPRSRYAASNFGRRV